jgi:TetR/AcrR family transcriptional regulator, regulator of mycofactocin system
MRQRTALGRPPATSHAAIEEAAFLLFAEQGFDETTTDDIAEVAGIGRRTLFRYFPSKYDIPWGQFDDSLDYFRDTLAEVGDNLPTWRAVQRAVVLFNTFDAAILPQHHKRMNLILKTPSLQAHSVLMYERWREVIADYVAERTGSDSTGLLPRTAGHVSLALAMSAYEQWLLRPKADLTVLLDESMYQLHVYLRDE